MTDARFNLFRSEFIKIKTGKHIHITVRLYLLYFTFAYRVIIFLCYAELNDKYLLAMVDIYSW